MKYVKHAALDCFTVVAYTKRGALGVWHWVGGAKRAALDCFTVVACTKRGALGVWHWVGGAKRAALDCFTVVACTERSAFTCPCVGRTRIRPPNVPPKEGESPAIGRGQAFAIHGMAFCGAYAIRPYRVTRKTCCL